MFLWVSFWLILSACSGKQDLQLRWHIINVSGEHSSGDAHLLEMPGGEYVLIDTGYEGFAEPVLLPYLKNLGVQELALVVITHAHKNHYGGLLKLAEHVNIKRLAFTPPDAATCATEQKADRCNRGHVLQVLQQLKGQTDHLYTDTGSELFRDQSGRVRLQVLHQALSLDDPRYAELAKQTKRFTINDSSAVIKLDFGTQSVLFPGDIGETTGRYLVEEAGIPLRANLLAAPHHGVTPLPYRAFFEQVAPAAIVASISRPPYQGERGQPLRDYAREAGVPLYVTADLGSLIVTLQMDRFDVMPATPQ